MTCYLVIWGPRGNRIGSVPIEQRAEIERVAYLSLIQRDINGTEHVRVMGMRKGAL